MSLGIKCIGSLGNLIINDTIKESSFCGGVMLST